MFYVFHWKGIKRCFSIGLIFGFAFLVARFYILPEWIFPRKYSEIVEKYAEKYQLDQALVYAVIWTESKFQENAVSYREAIGLMQIREGTGKWAAGEIGLQQFQTADLFSPEVNVEIGCWYLSKLIAQYDEPLDTALAAYNAGSGNVSKWLTSKEYSKDGKSIDEIPFGETKRYVRRIKMTKKIYHWLYGI